MGRADIGCHGTKRRLQLNVSSMRRTGRSSAKLGEPDPTEAVWKLAGSDLGTAYDSDCRDRTAS